MALESACLPVPSEVVMPFSGYLASIGRFSLWGAALVATFGNLIGSLLAYWVGYYGGRPLAQKYGEYLFIKNSDLERAEKWFEKYGSKTVFFSRLLPVVRTFISLPVGIARMDIKKFVLYTFAGSLPWNLALTYLGLAMGQNWKILEVYFHQFDILIGSVIIGGGLWWILSHFKKRALVD